LVGGNVMKISLKDERAFGRAEKKQRIDLGEIYALVEEIHREEHSHAARPQ
jgi:hypothetical protein